MDTIDPVLNLGWAVGIVNGEHRREVTNVQKTFKRFPTNALGRAVWISEFRVCGFPQGDTIEGIDAVITVGAAGENME